MYNWTPREVSDEERRIEDNAARESYKLGYGEFFTRSLGLNFDRYNTVGNTIEEHKIIRAEEEAGTYQDEWQRVRIKSGIISVIPYPPSF